MSTSRDERVTMSSLDMRPVVARRVRTSDLAWSLISLLEKFHESIQRLVSPHIRSSTNFIIADDPRASMLKMLSSIYRFWNYLLCHEIKQVCFLWCEDIIPFIRWKYTGQICDSLLLRTAVMWFRRWCSVLFWFGIPTMASVSSTIRDSSGAHIQNFRSVAVYCVMPLIAPWPFRFLLTCSWVWMEFYSMC